VERHLLAWVPMIFIAAANGVLRDRWLSPRLGDLHGRQLSTLLLLGLLTAYMALVFRVWPLASALQAAAVGLAWLMLTLGFEFLLGRFVSGLSWRAMAAALGFSPVGRHPGRAAGVDRGPARHARRGRGRRE
jgi:hypothetical protein